MARRRTNMKLTKKILNYHFDNRMSHDAVARALRTSKGTVNNTINRFASSGLNWPLDSMTDSALESRLFPSVPELQSKRPPIAVPDMAYIEKELRRKHVTLELLWREYEIENPDGMSRATFYIYSKKHLPKDVDMKMIHKAEDKL